MADMLSDTDVGLLDDGQVGIGSSDDAPQPQGGKNYMSDADVGLLSDDQVGISAAPQSEGFLARTARTVAHNALPAAAGYAGAGAGAEAGAALGAPLGPVGIAAGGLIGGAVGALGAGYAASKAQHAALDAAGVNDDTQVAANEQAHPYETFATGLATNMAGMGPAAGAGRLVRGAGAVLQGGMEAGQELATEGKVSPSKVLLAAGAGALLPGTNRMGSAVSEAGAKLGRRIPGRPNVTASPDAGTAEDEAQTSPPPNVARGVAAESSPPDIEGDTIGNPQSRPVVGDVGRNLGKGSAPAGAGPDMLTQGDYSPDVAAALNAFRNAGNTDIGNPKVDIDASLKEAPVQTGFPQEASPPASAAPAPAAPAQADASAPTPAPAQAAAPAPAAATDIDASLKEAPIQTGFPQNPNTGKPTLGAKRPAPSPEAQQSAQRILKTLSDADVGLAPEQPAPEQPAPEAVHPDVQKVADVRNDVAEPTPAQAEAGNYAKGHPGRLFGRDVSIETPKGGTREDTKNTPPRWSVPDFPYDYGEFLGTKGADGDRVDVGVLGTGDRHFVIDQKDPATGKFDEHKVMAYAKDPTDALEHYGRAFTDGSGPDRVLSIKEATPDELQAWLAKPGKKTQPFDESAVESAGPTEGERSLPKVVTAAVTKMKEQGLPQEAIDRFMAMEPSARLGEASKFVNTGKSGAAREVVPSRPDRIRSAAPVVEGIVDNQGKPVTARTKEDAARKSADVKTMNDSYAKLLDATDKATERSEQVESLRTFLRATEGVKYKPAFKHEPYLARRATSELLGPKGLKKNPSDAAWQKFDTDMQLLRNGGANEVRNRGRIESDIGLSKRSGDEAIAGAEAENATHNDVEDNIIDAIDRANASKGEFDVPHEEAEGMVKPQPATQESIAKESENTKHLDVSNPHDRAQLAAALVKKRSTTKGGIVGSSKTGVALAEGSTPEAPQASAVRKIDVKTLDPDYVKRLLEGAAAPRVGSRLDSDDIIRMTKDSRNQTTKSLGRIFLQDEGGSVNLDKIIADIQRFKNKVTSKDYWKHAKLESHIARPAKTAAEQFARSLSNKAVKVLNGNIQQMLDLQKWSDSLPKELNNLDTLRRIYDTREADKIGLLSPEEQLLYNKHLKPMFDENDALFAAAKDVLPKHLVEMMGEKVEGDHTMRITRGDTAERNMFAEDEDYDPILSERQGLPVRPVGTMLDRKFHAMTDAKGNRFLIALNDDGFTVWHDRKPIKVTDENFQYKPGEKYTVGGKTFTMGKALTPEIEQHGLFGPGEKANYYHNAALSAAMANYDLGRILRYNKFVESFKSDPSFLKYARAPGAKAPDNYIPTKLANFDGWKFDPQLGYALDDMAQPGINEGAVSYVRSIARAITKTLFWLPVAHLANVGTDWTIGRSYRWAIPKSYLTLAGTSLKALKSVITQDEWQKQIRLHGGSTLYGGVLTQDAVNNLARGFGEAVKKQPAKWDIIAKKLGVGPSDLIDAVYRASRHVLWAGNDVAMTQAVLERVHEGMSMEQAIIHVERHLVNYRTPATILGANRGGRVVAQMLTEPALTVFGRYHWGLLNGWANTLRDLIKGNGAAKLDALGNLMAVGLIAFAVHPALDAAARYITGSKHASSQWRGAMVIPVHLAKALTGKEDITSPLKSVLTPSPLMQSVPQVIKNTDYRGKPIVERGLMQQASRGNLRSAGQAAVEAGEYAARTALSPYNTFATASTKGQSVGETLRDQVLDLRNPSARAIAYDARATRYNMEELKRRNGRGAGPAEKLYRRLTK